MKKIIVFTFLLFSIMVSAQNDAVEDTAAQPAITTAGKPNGKIAEMKMNKDGGKLVSGDGMLELIIPSGALSKKTTISIQPITNMVPNGNGNAYRLEPSGIQFQKPVQLVFHYDEDESKDSMQLLMGIAMQDDKGQWYGLKNFTLDTISKTLSGNISHFSDWSKFDAIKIDPGYARIKVTRGKIFNITGVIPSLENSGSDELVKLVKTKTPADVVWKVNGKTNGNSVVGTLHAGDKSGIMYKAPASIPGENPVALTAELKKLNYKTMVNGASITLKDLRLVSNILIYDNAYEITIVSRLTGFAGSELGSVTYEDSGRLVVSLNRKEIKLIEKENKNIAAAWGYDGKCLITKLKKGAGNVHISGTKSMRLIPPLTPGDNPWVEIEFAYTPTIMPLLQIKCPPVGREKEWTTDNTAQANAMMAIMPAFPQHAKFEAKEGEQTQIIREEGTGVFGVFVKFIIKKLSEEK